MNHPIVPTEWRANKRRRGATILIVLVLISVTLAFAFAMLRTQSASSQVQQNYDRRADAKQAAMAGLSIGMRRMSESDWAGVGVDLNGGLGNGLSYAVSFATGDPTITPGHPDEAEYPYRVTVTSTGTSIAAGDPTQQSSHTIRTVMQLVRRNMPDPPTTWTQVQPYTLYQWNADSGRTAEFELPTRIEGPVAIQNAIELCEQYPGSGNGEAFEGEMDGVSIFGSALSADTLADLTNGAISLGDLLGDVDTAPVGSWQFNELAGTETAADELVSNPGIYDGAEPGTLTAGGSGTASFNGTNGQVFLGSLGVYTGKLTILTRVKIDDFHPTMQLVSSSAGATTLWGLSIDGPEQRLRFAVRSILGSYKEITSPNDLLVTGQWFDVAAVYNGTKLKIYLNGVKVKEDSMFGYLFSHPAANLAFGGRAPGSARARYLRDLRAMQASGGQDYRPFDGSLSINPAVVSEETKARLSDDLGLPLSTLGLAAGQPVANPGQISQYQLFPGGHIYTVSLLAGSLSDTQLGPDPYANPLGLFVCTDELRLYDNVSISGTILTYRGGTAGDIRIAGNNVTLQAVDLPALDGATIPLQLPVAMVNNDVEIDSNSTGSLNGLAISWDDFRFRSGDMATDFQMTGKLIVSEIQVRKRTQWDQGDSWWNSRMSEFMRSINAQTPSQSRFPTWLASNYSLDPVPRFHVQPAANPTNYHWHDWSQPLFVADPADQGLRWELVDWRDSP